MATSRGTAVRAARRREPFHPFCFPPRRAPAKASGEQPEHTLELPQARGLCSPVLGCRAAVEVHVLGGPSMARQGTELGPLAV
jgi:hypothetical protein